MNDVSFHILLVDDDPEFINDFRILLPPHMQCEAVHTVADAYRFLHETETDVIFLDIDLGEGGNGIEFLGRVKAEWPYLPVIMISGNQAVDMIVAAIKAGASGYVGKSPDLAKLKISIERAIAENQLQRRYDLLESEIDQIKGDLVGKSPVMEAVRQKMAHLAKVASTVLITGQSGTGKELVARGIHRLSAQRNQPFIAINCAALARELIESELFGHEKGAFTGASVRRIGKFELAGAGTLFLDEITEIPLEVQAKLLRVLQEREFERVGGNRLITFDGRVLASTNRDIGQAVAAQQLREDLLFRLNVTHIHLPPLTDHKDDIPELVGYFVHLKAREMKKTPPQVSPEALNLLRSYHWPGNVRELSNAIESAIVHAEEDVLEPADFCGIPVENYIPGTYEEAKRLNEIQFQHEYLSVVLSRNNGNMSQTAREIGVTRQGLLKMMKRCGLS
ncbi:MAG: sigma-54 dependent transcriptional regulator [candidate division Zixibacteria bacterium]|nr:sigma-54 dependent transcriptional regulator [candidate division Zixibacteria bacterium]